MVAEHDPNKIERDRNEKLLDVAADVRKLEIGLFWQRSLFFWGFIGAAFVAYAAMKESDVRFPIACFGIVCSLAWTLANRGSKYWQEAWEQKVESVQLAALGQPLFSKIEPEKNFGTFWRARRYSVTSLTIALSDFTVLVWALLAIKAAPGIIWRAWDLASITSLGFMIAYVIAMLIGGRSQRDPPQISN